MRRTIDAWVDNGWEWGRPISRAELEKVRQGDWSIFLTPTRPVPKEWFCTLQGAEVLGLASGGGQQMPVFAALGARCTVLDYSEKQLESERAVARRENYSIEIVRADMTEPLPFGDDSFDLVFHPVSNCYIEDILPVWRECFRVLRTGGLLLASFDTGIIYAFNDDETALAHRLPYNPLKEAAVYEAALKQNSGVQFSHTIEEQLGGQLKAGFVLTDIYQDTNSSGKLAEYNVPLYYATRSVKPRH